jgi:hypothetical protein
LDSWSLSPVPLRVSLFYPPHSTEHIKKPHREKWTAFSLPLWRGRGR